MFPVRKLLLFALLSAADFTLTWHLLAAGNQAVYESNPVAAWWLGHFGWLGLAGFKAAMMALAAGLCVLVFLRRPRTGHRLLTFGCAAVAAVVLYSASLCEAVRGRPAGLDAAEAAPLLKEADRLEAARDRSLAYRDLMFAVSRDLRARRCTLEEAVGRLAATEQGRDPNWLRRFQLYYPGRTDLECLAVCALNHVELDLAGAADAPQVEHHLKTEFRALYGRDAPPSVREMSAGARAPAGPHVFANRAGLQ